MIVGMAFEQMKDSVLADERYRRLEETLLNFGGEQLVYMPEPPEVLDYLIAHGTLCDAAHIEQVEGLPSRCHENVEKRAMQQRGKELRATGYGLSPDGLWRQHSWLMRADGTIIETTVKRTAYFGFVYE